MSDASYHMPDPDQEIDKHLEMLGNPEQTLSRRSLAAFSDLDQEQRALFQSTWHKIARERRIEIIQTLHSLAEDNVDLDFRQIFLVCLDDPDDMVRAISVDGLWEDDKPRTLRRLLSMVHDPSSQVRVAVMLNLSRFAYRAEMGELAPADAQAVCTTLLDVTADSSQPLEVRRRAVEGLGYFAQSPEAQTELQRAYEHHSQPMRESALVAMGRSMLPQWFTCIEDELHNSSPALRYAAAQAAGELAEDGEPLLPSVLPLADDDDTEVAMAAIWALGQIGGEDAQQVLKRMARSKDEIRRQAASDALQELCIDEL